MFKEGLRVVCLFGLGQAIFRDILYVACGLWVGDPYLDNYSYLPFQGQLHLPPMLNIFIFPFMSLQIMFEFLPLFFSTRQFLFAFMLARKKALFPKPMRTLSTSASRAFAGVPLTLAVSNITILQHSYLDFPWVVNYHFLCLHNIPCSYH